jgi:hypothetical protein
MISLIDVFSSFSRVGASALGGRSGEGASRRVGFFMVFLLACSLYGHGAFLLGSADAGVLGISPEIMRTPSPL